MQNPIKYIENDLLGREQLNFHYKNMLALALARWLNWLRIFP